MWTNIRFKFIGLCRKQIFYETVSNGKCCESKFCLELLSAIHDRRARKFDLR